MNIIKCLNGIEYSNIYKVTPPTKLNLEAKI